MKTSLKFLLSGKVLAIVSNVTLLFTVYVAMARLRVKFIQYSITTFATLAGASHFAAQFSNAGKIHNTLPRSGWTNCLQCEAARPQHAHHCSKCKMCVVRMDHHCPWINNCVGLRNHRYFFQFLFYTLCTCLSTLMGVYYELYTQEMDDLIFLDILLAFLFAAFTTIMIIEQFCNVWNNTLTIDNMKGIKTDESDMCETMSSFMGEFGVLWFLPIPSHSIENLYQNILDTPVDSTKVD
jgi:hypothetical protein